MATKQTIINCWEKGGTKALDADAQDQGLGEIKDEMTDGEA